MAQPSSAAPTGPPRVRLGDLLIREGLIRQEQLQRGLDDQKAYGGRIGRHLVDLGFVTEAQLLDTLSRQLKLPRIDLDAAGTIAADVARYVRADLAEQWGFCPVAFDPRRNVLTIATSDPDPQVLTDIEGFTGFRVEPRIASSEQIDRAIRRVFHGEGAPVENRRIQGLQVARSERGAAEAARLNDSFGPATASGRPPAPQPGAPPGGPDAYGTQLGVEAYNAQLAQQLTMQQQLQHQLQQQIQLQQMQHLQLQAAHQQGYAPPGAMPSPSHPPAAGPPPPNAQGYGGYTGYYGAAASAPAPSTPPPSLHGSNRASPAVPVEPEPATTLTLEALAEQLTRLEKTLGAQARALRSLVEVLVDKGLLSKAEMARKQQNNGR